MTKKNEFSLEKFGKKKYLIKQSEDYKFTLDSVLLANYSDLDKVSSVLDLGCSTGVLCFILDSRKAGMEITGVDIQKNLSDIAKENVLKNKLENINIINGDYTDKNLISEGKKFDLIVSNPPYMKSGSGILPEKESERYAKFEYKMDFPDLLRCVNRNIKNNGRFVFIHKADRLTELLGYIKKYKFGVKSLQFIHSDRLKKAHLFIAECVKNINSLNTVRQPLIIFDDNGEYIGDLKELFDD